MNWTTQVNCRRGRFPQKLLFRKIFVTFVIGNRLLPSSHSLSIDRDLFCLVVSRVPLFTGIQTLTNVSNFTNMSHFTNMQLFTYLPDIPTFKAHFLKVNSESIFSERVFVKMCLCFTNSPCFTSGQIFSICTTF